MSEIPDTFPVDDIDYDSIATEDDEPVDNLHSEREQKLLVDALYASWKPGREFLAAANVGVFYSPGEPPYVPDAFVSLDVRPLPHPEQGRFPTYFIWQYGKPPDLVVEVVSNIERHEERKIREYAKLGIAYYVIHDPLRKLSHRELRAYELRGNQYAEVLDPRWIPALGLGMRLWEGDYQGAHYSYLRWCDEHGELLKTAGELLAQDRQRVAELEARLRELEG